jgi:hypothetical protein
MYHMKTYEEVMGEIGVLFKHRTFVMVSDVLSATGNDKVTYVLLSLYSGRE